jgi:hypothetical protein
MKNFVQCFSLRPIRPFVDDDLLRAVAFVDLPRPGHEHRPVQAAEIRVVEVSLLDVAAHARLAAPLGWFRTELAWAAPGAVAGLELHTVKHPSISHRILLVSRCSELSIGFHDHHADFSGRAGNIAGVDNQTCHR